MLRTSTFLAFFLIGLGLLTAQKGNISSLQIKDIMQGDAFVGPRPSNAHWATDSKTLYFDWNPDGSLSDSLYAYSVSTKDTKKIDFLTANSLPSSRLIYNQDKTQAVYSKNGDIFLLDLNTYQSKPITKTQARESGPHFTDNGKSIAFEKNDELFTWNIASGLLEQKTRFVKSKNKEPQRDSKDEWLYQDQLEIFDVLQERKAKNDRGEEISSQLEALEPLELKPRASR